MFSNKLVLCSVIALYAAYTVYAQAQVSPISEACLGCVCEAVSHCNRSLTTCQGSVCGIFRITWAYWADAGKPVLKDDNPANDGAYARCVNDLRCAAKTVSGYMAKFAQDCDRNGVIDCYDYGAIHKLGGYGCGGELPPDYKNRLLSCLQFINGAPGNANQNQNFDSSQLVQPLDVRSGLNGGS